MEFEASKTTIGKTSGINKFQVFNYSSSPPPLSSRSTNNKNFYICNELNTIEKICDKDPILKLIFSLSSSSFDSKIALQNEIRAKLTELNSSESISSTQRTAMSSTTTSQQMAAAMATKSAYLQQLESKRNRQRLLEPYSSSSTTTTFNNQRLSTLNPIESSKTNPISSNDHVIECFKPIEKPEFLKKVDTYIRVNPSAAADNAMSFGKPKSIARRPMDLDERYNLKVHRRPISTTSATTTSMKAVQKQQPQPQQQEKQEDLNEYDESHNLRAGKNVSTDKDEMIINDEKEEEVIESQTKKEVEEEEEIVADLKTIDDEIIMINEEFDNNQIVKENLNDNLNGNEIQNDDLPNNNENSFEIMENQFNLESTNNKNNAAEDNEITNNLNGDDVEPKQPEIVVEENQTMRVKLNTKSFLEKLFNRELNLNHDFDNNDDDERENRDDDDDSLKENADKKNLDDKERVVVVELPKEVENVLDMLFSRKDATIISNDKQIKEQISEEKLEETPDRKQQRTESSSSTNSAADEKAATTIKSDLSSSLILKNENLNRAKENLNRQPQKTSIKREKLIKQPSLNSNVTSTSVENKTNQDENRIATRKEKPINNRVANVKKKNVTFIEDPKYGMIAVEIPEWQETLRDRHASPDAIRKRKLFAKKAT